MATAANERITRVIAIMRWIQANATRINGMERGQITLDFSGKNLVAEVKERETIQTA